MGRSPPAAGAAMMIPLGPFELAEPVGRGGIGEVWRGRHTLTAAPVAVKVLQHRWSSNLEIRASFRDEARMTARLDHPGVITLLDHGVVPRESAAASGGRLWEGSPFLAMEYASGRSLDQLSLPLPWPETREILLALLDALAHAHARGVLHRDLKPSNVLHAGGLDLRSGLILTDFGIARALDQDAADALAGAGTPAYMAPEQVLLRWRDQGPWTDLYALGCLAWKLSTGRTPYTDDHTRALAAQRLAAAPPAVPPLPGFPEGFPGWLKKMTERSTADRFRRAGDAASILARLTGDGEHDARTFGLTSPSATISLGALIEGPGSSPSPLLPRWRPAPAPRTPVRLLGAGLGLFEMRVFPLVGRDAERDQLWGFLEEVVTTRQPRAVLVRGAVGSGKSRLVAAVAERAHELAVAEVLTAVHDPAAGPGHGLVRMLARYLRSWGLEGEDLAVHLRQVFPAAAELSPAVADFLSGEVASGIAESERPGWRHRLLREVISRLAGGRVVVLVLDDVEWAPDAVELTLSILRESAAEVPVLLLLTTSGPGEGEGGDDLARRVPTIDLGPLPDQAITALVGHFLSLDTGTAEDLCRRSGGNPLFAVQFVRDWTRRGVLRVTDEGLVPDPSVASVLPQDLRELWTAALERTLGAISAHGGRPLLALQVAAALGVQVVDTEWRAACARLELTCHEALTEAIFRGHLAEPTEDGWRFAHGMIAECLTAEAREAGDWARIHLACAHVLVTSTTAGASGRRGRHLLEGGETSDALDALLGAARRHLDRFAFREARPLMRLIEERVLTDARIASDDPRRGEAALYQARNLLGLGRLAEAERVAARSADVARQHRWPALRARALRYRGMALAKMGSLALAEAVLTQAEILAGQVGDDENLAACLEHRGTLLRQSGDLDGSAGLLSEALEVYRRLGEARLVADCQKELGGTCVLQGRLDEGRRWLSEASALYLQLGSSVGVGQCHNNLGDVERRGGHVVEAEQNYRTAFAALHAAGHPAAAIPLLNLGQLLVATGEYVTASETFGRSLELAVASRKRATELQARAFRLPCRAHQGEWREWEAEFPIVRRLSDETGLVDAEIANALTLAAELAELHGEPERSAEARALAALHRGAG